MKISLVKKFNLFFCWVTILLIGFIASTYAGSFYCPLTLVWPAGKTLPDGTVPQSPFTFDFSGRVEWFALGNLMCRYRFIIKSHEDKHGKSSESYDSPVFYDGFGQQPSGGNWVVDPNNPSHWTCKTKGDVNNCLIDKYDNTIGG